MWHITYESVPCLSNWSGAKNPAALGSVKELGTSACCPAEPQPGNASNSCPSYSDKNGIPYVPRHSPIQSTMLTALAFLQTRYKNQYRCYKLLEAHITPPLYGFSHSNIIGHLVLNCLYNLYLNLF